MKFRAVDRRNSNVIPVDKISFHLGRPHVLNDRAVTHVEFQRWDEEERDWLPVTIVFES